MDVTMLASSKDHLSVVCSKQITHSTNWCSVDGWVGINANGWMISTYSIRGGNE